MKVNEFILKYKTKVEQYKIKFEIVNSLGMPFIVLSIMGLIILSVCGFNSAAIASLLSPILYLSFRYKVKKTYQKNLNSFIQDASLDEKRAYYNLSLLWHIEDVKYYEHEYYKEVIKILQKEPEKLKMEESNLEYMCKYISTKKIKKYSSYSTEELKAKLINKLNKKMQKEFDVFEKDYQKLLNVSEVKLENEDSVFNLKKSISTAI